MKFLITSLLTASICLSQAGPATSRTWRPAVYHGLIIGTSKRREVITKLGEPNYVGKEEDTGAPYLSYSVSDPFEGTLAAYIDHGTLSMLILTLRHPMPIKAAVETLGPTGLLRTNYSLDNCVGGAGAGPIYENPRGDIEYVEYRSRGLALAVYEDKVESVSFVAKPLGSATSKCPARTLTKQGPKNARQ
jgi:hypothetical protein